MSGRKQGMRSRSSVAVASVERSQTHRKRRRCWWVSLSVTRATNIPVVAVFSAVLVLATTFSASGQDKKAPVLAGWPGVFPEFQGYARTFEKPKIVKGSYEQTANYEWTGGRVETASISLLRDPVRAKRFSPEGLKSFTTAPEKVAFGNRTGYREEARLTIPLGDDRLIQLESAARQFPSDLVGFAKKLNLDACAKALEQPPRVDGRSIERFRALKKGMPLGDVQAWVGDSNLDIGSGIHILVYPLADGSRVLIGFPDFSKLIYVKHQADGKVVDLVK